VLYRTDVEANLHVCPKCDHHMRIGSRERLDKLLDAEGRYEIGQEIVPVDALKFKDTKKYPDRIKAAMDDTGETDAMVVMGGAIHTRGRGLLRVRVHGRFDGLGGGRAFCPRRQAALEQKVPFICVTATGGARMQESLLSLMQMAKTTAMLNLLSNAKLPFISVLTDPTMGGVSASFAFLGDVVIAEPKALIGLPARVIEQTVRESCRKASSVPSS
jgi:acetyl-CoA carboxylase carboxyl transferase subunit beta